MQKIYIIDTNVLLHNPNAMYAFDDNQVVIPLAVIEEIDNQKRRQDEIGRNARRVSRMLDELRSKGQLSRGITMAEGGSIRVEVNHLGGLNLPGGLEADKYDNRILGLTQNMGRENQNPVVLVTKDLNLRVKADVLGIPAQDFTSDNVDYRELHHGYRELFVNPDDLNGFYRDGGLVWERESDLHPNEFIVLKSAENGSQSALCRHFDGMLQPLIHEEATNWGIRARNKEQPFALELLMDDAIPVVTLVGSAGTGKTLLALAVGLEKVIERKVYNRFLIIRRTLHGGRDRSPYPLTGILGEEFKHLLTCKHKISAIGTLKAFL